MANAIGVSLDRPGVAAARMISDVLSPPAMAVPALVLGVWASDAVGTYRYAVLYFLLAILMPLLYVVWLLKSGRIADFHLPNRRDRTGPFVVFLLCGLVALGLLVYLGAPASFVAPVIALLFQTLLLFLITLTWQVSIHTASTAGLVTFAVLALGIGAAALFVLVPLVGWARIHLRRHTLAQTLAGALVGCSSFLLLFALRGLAW